MQPSDANQEQTMPVNANEIAARIETRNAMMTAKVVQAQHNADAYAAKLQQIPGYVAKVEEALQVMGLTIEDLHFGKTGSDENWTETTQVTVAMYAVPTSKKFKFIKFAGYTARGADKNQERLEKKSREMVDVLRAATGLEHVGVNPFSIEVKDENETGKRVMVQFWF